MSDAQRLAFSIIEFFKSENEFGSLPEDSKESLEVVIECLERVYNISLENESDVSKLHFQEPLTNIFRNAIMSESTRQLPTEADKIEAERLKTEGNNLMQQGRCTEAIKSYNKAMGYDWTNAVYLCNRAAAHSKLDQHEQAVNDCRKALELDDKYGKAYGRMGMAYMSLEKYAEARNSYAKAVELEPSNELYKNNLSAAEEKLGGSKQQPSSQPTGLPGGPNLINSLFSNPGIMNMAQQFMSNPQMQQMMSNMMGGMAPAGDQPNTESTQVPSDPAGHAAEETTNPQNTANPQGATTNPQGATTNPQGATTNPQGAGFSDIFQFASQMAQQLQQDNPGLVNDLRQAMQGDQPPDTTPAPGDPASEEKK